MRRGKAFHPDGVVYDARLSIVGDPAAPAAAELLAESGARSNPLTVADVAGATPQEVRRAGAEVIGTLNIGRMGEAEAHFSQNEFELTKLFAGQASIALHNAEIPGAIRVAPGDDRDEILMSLPL